MSKRLTRKEIKHDIREDQFRVGIQRAFEFVSQNARMILFGAIGLVVLTVAVLGFRYYMDLRQDRAADALGEAMAVYGAEIVDEGAEPDNSVMPTFATEDEKRARSRELFERVVREHGNTSAGGVAKVYLARIYFQEGRVEEAKEHWREFLEENPGHMLAAAVKLNLLELERAEGNTESVVEDLRASLEAKDSAIPTDALLFELAQSLEELERTEEARDMYQRLADEYPDSAFAGTAQERLRELEPAAA